MLQSIEPRIKKQVFEILTSEKSIEEKLIGGRVKNKLKVIKRAKQKIKNEKRLFKILFLLLLSISVFGCGKKSDLVKYPDSNIKE